MEAMRLALAVLLPWAVGTMVWVRLTGRSSAPGRLPLLLGGGLLLGMLFTAVLTRVAINISPQHSFWIVCMAFGLVVTMAVAADNIRRWLPAPGLMHWPGLVQARWQQLLMLLLLLVLGVRFAHLALEVYWRPIYPWDAWGAWALKARYWYLSNSPLEFVSAAEWVAVDRADARYSPAWHYPALIPALQTWMVSAFGSWHEPVANLPWLLLWVALGLMVYGQLRVLGAAAWLAMLTCYAILSLPLVNAHVALAGYADLWIGVLLCGSALALLHWQLGHGRGWLLLGGLLALLLTGIKLEGTFWMLCLFLALGISQLREHWRWPALLTTLVLVALVISLVTFSVKLPLLGTIAVQPGRLEFPALGVVDISWQPVLDSVLFSLFQSGNWHLFWFVMPVIAIACWRQALEPRVSFFPAAVLVLGASALGVLFFFTDASRWAEDHTSLSRLVLHLVPLCACWLALVAGRRMAAVSAPSEDASESDVSESESAGHA